MNTDKELWVVYDHYWDSAREAVGVVAVCSTEESARIAAKAAVADAMMSDGAVVSIDEKDGVITDVTVDAYGDQYWVQVTRHVLDEIPVHVEGLTVTEEMPVDQVLAELFDGTLPWRVK